MEQQSKFRRKAFISGVVTFIVLYILLVTVGHLAGLQHGRVLFILQVLVFVISGYVGGWVAGQNGWYNGLMIGIPLPLVLAVGFMLMAPKEALTKEFLVALVLFWYMQSLALCAFGGLLADIQRRVSKPRQ